MTLCPLNSISWVLTCRYWHFLMEHKHPNHTAYIIKTSTVLYLLWVLMAGRNWRDRLCFSFEEYSLISYIICHQHFSISALDVVSKDFRISAPKWRYRKESICWLLYLRAVKKTPVRNLELVERRVAMSSSLKPNRMWSCYSTLLDQTNSSTQLHLSFQANQGTFLGTLN